MHPSYRGPASRYPTLFTCTATQFMSYKMSMGEWEMAFCRSGPRREKQQDLEGKHIPGKAKERRHIELKTKTLKKKTRQLPLSIILTLVKNCLPISKCRFSFSSLLCQRCKQVRFYFMNLNDT